LLGQLFIGIDLSEVSPVIRIRTSTITILLIHSSADAVIPFSHARQLQEALANNTSAEFWFNEGFAHGELGSDYPRREFFQQTFIVSHRRLPHQARVAMPQPSIGSRDASVDIHVGLVSSNSMLERRNQRVCLD
jgi:hypothetical protein